MDAILRAAAIYIFLYIVLRLAGKRTLSQITAFDFVLLLIIGESVQQGLLGNDFSVTNAFLVIVTLLSIDIAVSLAKQRSGRVDTWLEGIPLVIVEDGRPLRDRMRMARVDEGDILAAARELQGLERMDQVKYAVLERSGGITIVPKVGARA
jgi:uncharacterized membrane protein YcaP (DUF421 family)